MKKTSKVAKPTPDVVALRREVKALASELAKAKKELAKLQGVVRDGGSKLTARALDIVDAKGNVMASIDGRGVLACSAASISPTPQGARIILGKDGLVAGTRVEVRDKATHATVVAVTSGSSGGNVTLTNRRTKQRLDLSAENAAFIAYEPVHGHGVAMLNVKQPPGGQFVVTGPDDGNQPQAWLGIAPDGSGGVVLVTRKDGAVGGQVGP